MVKNFGLVWELLSKPHFQRNVDVLDFGLHFNDLFDLKMVPKLICG